MSVRKVLNDGRLDTVQSERSELRPTVLLLSDWLHRTAHSQSAPAPVRLRKETTLSVKQIAARLHLGTPGSASVCLLAVMNKTQPGGRIQGRLSI